MGREAGSESRRSAHGRRATVSAGAAGAAHGGYATLGAARQRTRRALALAVLGASSAAYLVAVVAGGSTWRGGVPAAAMVAAREAPAAEAAGATPTLDPADRVLLRAVFGIDDPDRLFIDGSSADSVLRYHARPVACARARAAACRAVTVRVGLTSPRRAGETWDAFVGRVVRGGTGAWAAARNAYYTGLVSLDPEAARAFTRLVADARHAGFSVRVGETYRSPERQALLLARGDGRTQTATSVHAYGRAADLVVGDGRIDRPETARQWIAFRRWVVRYRAGIFRIVGAPDRTWDWPHVELASSPLGFRSVAALLAAARACRAVTPQDLVAAAARCTVTPTLPAHLAASARPAPAASAHDRSRSPQPAGVPRRPSSRKTGGRATARDARERARRHPAAVTRGHGRHPLLTKPPRRHSPRHAARADRDRPAHRHAGE